MTRESGPPRLGFLALSAVASAIGLCLGLTCVLSLAVCRFYLERFTASGYGVPAGQDLQIVPTYPITLYGADAVSNQCSYGRCVRCLLAPLARLKARSVLVLCLQLSVHDVAVARRPGLLHLQRKLRYGRRTVALLLSGWRATLVLILLVSLKPACRLFVRADYFDLLRVFHRRQHVHQLRLYVASGSSSCGCGLLPPHFPIAACSADVENTYDEPNAKQGYAVCVLLLLSLRVCARVDHCLSLPCVCVASTQAQQLVQERQYVRPFPRRSFACANPFVGSVQPACTSSTTFPPRPSPGWAAVRALSVCLSLSGRTVSFMPLPLLRPGVPCSHA